MYVQAYFVYSKYAKIYTNTLFCILLLFFRAAYIDLLHFVLHLHHVLWYGCMVILMQGFEEMKIEFLPNPVH